MRSGAENDAVAPDFHFHGAVEAALAQYLAGDDDPLELRFLVSASSLLSLCDPERSEGSLLVPLPEILRCAQDDSAP